MSNIKIPKLNISGNRRTPGRSRSVSRRSNMQSNRSTMSESRRNKLLAIQKREKLKALLVKKFRMQYGTSRQMDKVILRAIDGFVNKKRVTEQDLDSLGKQIAAAAKQLGKTPINTPSSTRKNNNTPNLMSMSQSMNSTRNSGMGGPTIASLSASASTPLLNNNNSTPMPRKLAPLSRTPQQQQQQPATPSLQESGMMPGDPVEEDWTLIFRYQQKKQNEEAVKERGLKKQEREGTLSSLQALTAAKEKRKHNAKKLDADYSQSVQDNMKKWKIEEDTKRAKLKAAIKKQSLVRKKQMDDRKRRAAVEKKQKLKYETNLMKRLNRETELQKEREKNKIINDKKRLVAFLAGNAEVRKRKDAIVAKEREEDVQRMKEYAIILKKQEDSRKEFFAGRAAKMDKNAANNEKARESELAETRAREQRDLRFQKEKDDAIVQKEAKAKAWRKKNQQDINNWLNKTIAQKNHEREKEKSMYIEINNYAKKKAAEVSYCVFVCTDLGVYCCCCSSYIFLTFLSSISFPLFLSPLTYNIIKTG
jgi:hypothetical protein